MDPAALSQILSYNPETGGFIHLARPAVTRHAKTFNSRYAGKPALHTLSSDGYWFGTLGNRPHLAHRVAWAMVHGEWPDGPLDHINGDKLDNRISNLRRCTHQQNEWNSVRRASSGFKGVYPCKGKWQARITLNKAQVFLGTFVTPEEAARARDEAARCHHGEFARLNFPLSGEQAA